MDREPTPSEPNPPRQTVSIWSIQVLRVSGIPLRIHFTFLLFLGWIYVSGEGKSALPLVGLMVAVFGCVVLHEFGHAFTARRYGIQTRDITLYPIGGVAMLQGRPKAAQELWIALAGPAVNVAIALLLAPISQALYGRLPLWGPELGKGAWIDSLFTANVILILFNMVPAFPMDGGRVLRAILALTMNETKATRIAGGIGQLIAIAFGFWGLLDGNVVWMLIAFFVYLGAAQEVQATVGYSLVANRSVRDAMQTRFRVIESGQTLDTAAKMLLDGSQSDFPVMVGDEPVGVLTRGAIAGGLSEEGPDAYVAGHMDREVRRLRPEEPLEVAMNHFSDGNKVPILVTEGEALVGILTPENLSEFIMLEHARSSRRPS